MEKYMQNFDDFKDENLVVATEDEQKISVHKIWKLIDSGDDFGFICASRGTDNIDTNAERLNKLELEIMRNKGAYIPVKYGYSYPGQGGCTIKHEDTTLFVSGITLVKLIELGKKYGQDVVVYGNNDAVQSYQTSDGKADVALSFAEMKLAMCTVLLFPGTFRGR